MKPGRCKCCGFPVQGARAAIELCVVCDHCDRRHGDALQLHVMQLLRARQISVGHALARMLIDDAHLAGELMLIQRDPAVPIAVPWIAQPVKRWRVVTGRAFARDEPVEMELLVGVILGRYIPGKATRENLDELRRDLIEAFTTLDDNVVDIEVDCTRDVIDPAHLIINIHTKTAAAPGMTAIVDDQVELPDDIMARPRGQA
jgi:hypothetical protein